MFPEEVLQLSNLTSLDLSANNLEIILPNIETLSQLKTLDLGASWWLYLACACDPSSSHIRLLVITLLLRVHVQNLLLLPLLPLPLPLLAPGVNLLEQQVFVHNPNRLQ